MAATVVRKIPLRRPKEGREGGGEDAELASEAASNGTASADGGGHALAEVRWEAFGRFILLKVKFCAAKQSIRRQKDTKQLGTQLRLPSIMMMRSNLQERYGRKNDTPYR